jgi:hypothetical protein
MSERKGDWMITFTGRQFWPLDPRPDEVCIDDIATALAHTGRYNGQGRHFFSVAQHSTLLARWFLAKGDTPLARWALLHDGSEAYAGDVIRPIKPFLAGFAEIEHRLERAVWSAFGLDGDLPAAVKDADQKIRTDEMLALFPREALQRYGLDQRAGLGLEVRPLLPTAARDRFMETYRELFA